MSGLMGGRGGVAPAPGVVEGAELAVVNDALAPETKGQEVALTVYGDSFLMENCRLTSTQDTLFLGPLPDDLIDRYEGFLPDELRLRKPCRQVFRDCLIEGTVDFVFGCGLRTYARCRTDLYGRSPSLSLAFCSSNLWGDSGQF